MEYLQSGREVIRRGLNGMNRERRKKRNKVIEGEADEVRLEADGGGSKQDVPQDWK